MFSANGACVVFQAVIVDAQIGVVAVFVAQVLDDPLDLVGWNVIGDIEFIGAVAQQLLAFILGRVVPDLLQGDVFCVVEIGVGHQLDVRLRHPFIQREGAVTDQVTGPCPGAAMFFDGGTVQRKGHVMGQHVQEIGRGCVQRDL